MRPDSALEFYETPQTFTRYLFDQVHIAGHLHEPCVGDGALVRAATPLMGHGSFWTTNDLDLRWPADTHLDATEDWPEADPLHPIDWTVSNTPFTPALEIAALALEESRIGVALHLRASIHEVLKTGPRRTWMNRHRPTGILYLPRFAYQRSRTTGKWTTDSMGACWVVWLNDPGARQFIRYAPEWVIDELDAETPGYRARMDALMGHAVAV